MPAPIAARVIMATTKTTLKPPKGASMSHSATAGNKIVLLAARRDSIRTLRRGAAAAHSRGAAKTAALRLAETKAAQRVGEHRSFGARNEDRKTPQRSISKPRRRHARFRTSGPPSCR